MSRAAPNAVVIAVSRGRENGLRKSTVSEIRLVEGLGVDGDAHQGVTVQHRSRKAKDPTLPNLRQVHLIHAELHTELAARGFAVAPGQMAENVTTEGIDLLALPTSTRLHLGDTAVVELTGLRNPCKQLNGLAPDLMEAVLERGADGKLVRKAGVMAVVLVGGVVRAGDRIYIETAALPHQPLEPV